MQPKCFKENSEKEKQKHVFAITILPLQEEKWTKVVRIILCTGCAMQ